MPPPGQNSGQPTWDVYVDGLVREHGSLAAVAQRLAQIRGGKEHAESIERALRRLRTRGALPGGQWGARLLATFGLPASIESRLRFMGSYHSRFVDLPVPLCTDLVQLWDRPPASESRSGRLWLSLARATLALRARDAAGAREQLDAARAFAAADPAGRVELALGDGLVASILGDAAHEARALAPVSGWLEELSGPDADCLLARYVGQLSHRLNRIGEIAAAEALHRWLPDEPTTAPFARSRRANGIAYARFRHGDRMEARVHAWLAVRYAGDAGHVRLRAMALLMVARVSTDREEAGAARERARAIAHALDDATLLSRCDASARDR